MQVRRVYEPTADIHNSFREPAVSPDSTVLSRARIVVVSTSGLTCAQATHFVSRETPGRESSVQILQVNALSYALEVLGVRFDFKGYNNTNKF
jgi:hypothetical protein